VTLTVSVDEVVEESDNPLLRCHESWDRIRLKEVADVLNGKAFSSDYFSNGQGKPLLRIRDIGSKETEKNFSGEYDDNYVVHPGDLVVGMDGDFICELWNGPEALLNQRVCKISPDESIYNKRFLSYVLQPYLDAIHARTSATTVKHLSSTDIKEIPLPAPQLNEQKRIVAKIEELFSKLDSGVSQLNEAQMRLEQYRRAVLKAGISGSLSVNWRKMEHGHSNIYEKEDTELITESYKSQTDHNYPDDWRVIKINQICDVESGATPLRGNDDYWGGDIPWVKSGAVNKNKIQYAEEFITQQALDETSVVLFPPGTIIVAMYGATRGKHSILEIEATTNQACAGIIIPEIFSFLKSWIDIYLSIYYQELKRQGAGGAQLNLNLGIIRSTEIPVPPKKEIEYICNIIERQLSIIESTEENVMKSLEINTIIRQSILKHAFEGTLVPREPTEKPMAPNGGDTSAELGAQLTQSEAFRDAE
jgi:type I restriction enzyme S subunit